MCNHLLSKYAPPCEASLLHAEVAGLFGSVHSIFSASRPAVVDPIYLGWCLIGLHSVGFLLNHRTALECKNHEKTSIDLVEPDYIKPSNNSDPVVR